MRIESTDATVRIENIQNSADSQRARDSVDLSEKHDVVIDKGSVEKDEKLSERMVIGAIEKANEAIVVANRQLEFSVHEKTKEIMVKVIDTRTKEVIREIPPEKILDMVASILEMAGILVDERR